MCLPIQSLSSHLPSPFQPWGLSCAPPKISSKHHVKKWSKQRIVTNNINYKSVGNSARPTLHLSHKESYRLLTSLCLSDPWCIFITITLASGFWLHLPLFPLRSWTPRASCPAALLGTPTAAVSAGERSLPRPMGPHGHMLPSPTRTQCCPVIAPEGCPQHIPLSSSPHPARWRKHHLNIQSRSTPLLGQSGDRVTSLAGLYNRGSQHTLKHRMATLPPSCHLLTNPWASFYHQNKRDGKWKKRKL